MGRIICGAAKSKITPPADLIPDLYGLMRKRFAGVIDDLHVRVMYLSDGQENVLLISWDLDKAPVPERIVPKLAEMCSVPQDHILFFATHTHTAPLHSNRPNDGPNALAKQDEKTREATGRYESLLEEAVLCAAKEAMDKAQPVRIGWGLGESWIGEHRLQDFFVEKEDGTVEKITALGSDPAGEIDRTLFLMRVESLDGKPICFFVNHAVHNCVMICNNYDGNGCVGMSADLAGQVSTLIEQKFPGCVALWSSGAAGDINPKMFNQYTYPDPETGAPFDFNDYKSAEPAKLMCLVLSRRQFADVLRTNRAITCDISEAAISAGNITVGAPQADTDEPYKVRLQAAGIGDLIFCGASGELFGSLGAAIRNVSKDRTVIVINHESTHLQDAGYIFDDDALIRCTRPDGKRDGLPGLKNSRLKPGYIKDALVNGATELFGYI